MKRVDQWFELHLWEPEKPWFSPDYVAFMAQLPCPVWMLEPVPAIPGSVGYPKQDIVDRYGVGAVWFYTSSLSWMFAAAIAAGADEIGLWGVDMSAGEEIYTHQRAGCHYWIGKALEMGIKVTIPQQSDLMRPAPLYGFNELDHMHQKLLAREEELTQRYNHAAAMFEQARNEMLSMRGAAEDVKYARQTFVSDRQIEDIIRSACKIKEIPALDPRLQKMAEAEEARLRAQAAPELKVGDVVDLGGGASITIEEVYREALARNEQVPTDNHLHPQFQPKPDHLGDLRTPVAGNPGAQRTIDEIKAKIATRWESTAVPNFIEAV